MYILGCNFNWGWNWLWFEGSNLMNNLIKTKMRELFDLYLADLKIEPGFIYNLNIQHNMTSLSEFCTIAQLRRTMSPRLLEKAMKANSGNLSKVRPIVAWNLETKEWY